MNISIIVPTFNNLSYLKFFLSSIEKNSQFNHQIILHINEGSDGTLEFAKQNNLNFTYSEKNIGLCRSLNKASKLVNKDHILYAHDDMFFCYKWDYFLNEEVKKYSNNLYYLTGTNVSKKNGLINFDCGTTPEIFNEKKFNDFCLNDQSQDLQGSHWAPHLIHTDLWRKIGGFGEEFDPGDGSIPILHETLDGRCKNFKTISKLKFIISVQ